MTGAQIRAMRLAMGLTVRQLAAVLGVTGACVRKWEAYGGQDATPRRRRSPKWEALVAYLLASRAPLKATVMSSTLPTGFDGFPYPWLETAGPQYRERIRREIANA